MGAGTDAVTCGALSGTADYRIFEGQPQSLPGTLFTVRPLTVKGKQAGPVTLTVTLTDADIPASGSKDPEDTPSDDPSAPDSSSSGTGPTPEPSPDTLP